MNVVTDILLLPKYSHLDPFSEICTVSIEILKRSPMNIQEGQLKYDYSRKIIKTFLSYEKGTHYEIGQSEDIL